MLIMFIIAGTFIWSFAGLVAVMCNIEDVLRKLKPFWEIFSWIMLGPLVWLLWLIISIGLLCARGYYQHSEKIKQCTRGLSKFFLKQGFVAPTPRSPPKSSNDEDNPRTSPTH